MKVVYRNVRCEAGEIDLVAEDGACLVFVEVKTWPGCGLENLRFGIDKKKKKRIIETAKYFLFSHREYNERPIRFDVVFLDTENCIRFESAFTET